jgi:hypothetical protein
MAPTWRCFSKKIEEQPADNSTRSFSKLYLSLLYAELRRYSLVRIVVGRRHRLLEYT